MQFTPRDIHALWLLIQHLDGLAESQLCSVAQTVLRLSSEDDVLHLARLGQHLGLLSRNAGLVTLTAEGGVFKATKHWRLWQPSSRQKETLAEAGLEHIFLDPDAYANRPVVIDLFAGAGGLSLGFAAAGFDIALAIDNDVHACAAHQINFPDTTVHSDDIGEFANDPKGYIKKIPLLDGKKITGIIGGPPCQGFSVMGERLANDERNLLTSRFIDIVLALEPDFFVMENVPGLATIGVAPSFTDHIGRLAKSNSTPTAIIVDACLNTLRVSGKRERQYIKRTVSDIVREFRVRAEHYFCNCPDAFFDLKRTVVHLHEELVSLLTDGMLTLYNDERLVTKLLADCSLQVASISVAVAGEHFLKRVKLTERERTAYFEGLASLFAIDSVLYNTVQTIVREYESFPHATEYLGMKMGPILRNLIERASTQYDVAPPRVLNAASFGTPQNRDRLFIVGIKKNLKRSFSYPEPSHLNIGSVSDETTSKLEAAVVVKSAIADLPDIDEMPELIEGHEFSASKLGSSPTEFAKKMRLEWLDEQDFSLPRPTWNPYLVDCSNRTTHLEDVRQRLQALEQGKEDTTSRKTRLHPDGLSPTIRAGTKANKGSHTAVRPVHYAYHRVISVREGARLMGYPDWMTFHKTKWHGFRLVGNGVPFPLSFAIAKQITNELSAPG